MVSRSQIFKIAVIVILFLLFLQYLYLKPAKLNTLFLPPSGSSGSSSNVESYDKSLFKTASRRKHDLPQEELQLTQNNPHQYSNSKAEDIKKPILIPNNNISIITTTIIMRLSKNKVTTTNKPKPLITNGKTIINANKEPTIINTKNTTLPPCLEKPIELQGLVNTTLKDPPTMEELSTIHSDLTLGGRYQPSQCLPRDKVGIIVPFRDREEHLRIFLFNLLPILKRQQIDFNIFVIEQGGNKDDPFNRAMLFNVGFTEANKIRNDFDCFIFHDVDLIPENDYNLYNCPRQPRHMSVAVDKMHYQLPYRTIFGGISALTKPHFIKVNGFSNSFWGWGAEDDDMAGRIAYNGLYISRPPPSVARYKMLKHKPQKINGQRYKILVRGKHRFKNDGLNSLKYSVEQVILEKTFTLIRVHLQR